MTRSSTAFTCARNGSNCASGKALGKLVIVTPNRRGLWARFEHTPFGTGRPFSRGQLTELLRLKQMETENLPPGAERSAQAGFGVSAFAWLALSKEIRVVGRYDTYDPNTDSDAKNDVRSLLIAALDYKVADNVNVMPGVEVIGREGVDASDVVPRVTFLWKF